MPARCNPFTSTRRIPTPCVLCIPALSSGHTSSGRQSTSKPAALAHNQHLPARPGHSASVDMSTTPTTSSLEPKSPWSQIACQECNGESLALSACAPAWKTMRPMRPKPLMPILTAIADSVRQQEITGALAGGKRWLQRRPYSSNFKVEHGG